MGGEREENEDVERKEREWRRHETQYSSLRSSIGPEEDKNLAGAGPMAPGKKTVQNQERNDTNQAVEADCGSAICGTTTPTGLELLPTSAYVVP